MDAVIHAVEVLDESAGRVLDAATANGYSAILTADHGNCDLMVDPETDEPHTQHTTNPVPFLVMDRERWLLAPTGTLGDVAPTVLELMGLAVPPEMTGRSLLIEAKEPQPLASLERMGMARAG